MANDTNVVWHEHQVARADREQQNGHRGCVIWFTGLSGSGKSTVANVLDHKLHAKGIHSAVLDGDNVRHALNAGPGMLREIHGEEFAQRFGLGFSAIDREENIRRIGEVAKLMTDAGLIVLTAFISPFRADRQLVRDMHPDRMLARGVPEEAIPAMARAAMTVTRLLKNNLRELTAAIRSMAR